jgi:hypothetical protein
MAWRPRKEKVVMGSVLLAIAAWLVFSGYMAFHSLENFRPDPCRCIKQDCELRFEWDLQTGELVSKEVCECVRKECPAEYPEP